METVTIRIRLVEIASIDIAADCLSYYGRDKRYYYDLIEATRAHLEAELYRTDLSLKNKSIEVKYNPSRKCFVVYEVLPYLCNN